MRAIVLHPDHYEGLMTAIRAGVQTIIGLNDLDTLLLTEHPKAVAIAIEWWRHTPRKQKADVRQQIEKTITACFSAGASGANPDTTGWPEEARAMAGAILTKV